jgi:hypothetical protein
MGKAKKIRISEAEFRILYLLIDYSLIPSLRDRWTLMAQGFWCVARRKTDGYPKITRGMTTLPHANT